jgi:aminoglycoside phosphotransferase (APT) family kinase protein
VTFDDAVRLIGRARTFADLGRTYRELAKLVHPDAVPAARTATATAACARLSALWAARAVISGDVADLTVDGDTLVKVPRDPADNDLMAAEATALSTVGGGRLVRTYVHEDAHRHRRTVNVLARFDGYLPLGDGPKPVAEAVAIWRGLLRALAEAHDHGLVHGAVLPEHVLVRGGRVVLVDWCYSVPAGTPLTAVVARHRDAYPPEVHRREPATPATDIHLAAGLLNQLTGHPFLRRFAAGCRYDAPRMRPQDAHRLLAEFDELVRP